MSSFGFDKVKKPAEQGERKLDLSGLTMQTPPVSADKEQRAIAKGEELGFTSREPTETKERKRGGKWTLMRRHVRTPTRSLYVQGPASVLDRYVAYANELKADAYWLDRRQKSARSMGAAGCATEDQNCADRVALG